MSERHPRLYLLDVEGTVAPLSLTTEVLFPYARKHLARYLDQNFKNSAVQDDLRLLGEENRAELSEDCPTFGVEIGNELHACAYLLWLMDRDRKSTALKSLQGKIWKAGFETGELKGTSFPDVPPAFSALGRERQGRHLFLGLRRGAEAAVSPLNLRRSDAADRGLLRYAHRAEDGERQLCGDCCGDGCRSGRCPVLFRRGAGTGRGAGERDSNRGWWCARATRRLKTRMGTSRLNRSLYYSL